MTVLRGHSIITAMHAERDLFSHPYTYEWDGENDPPKGHRVSRENLFSEPVEATEPTPDTQDKRPPRNPFG
jgi:hypothetical protein